MDGLRAAACAGARVSEQRAREYPGPGHNKIQVNFLQTVPVSAWLPRAVLYSVLYSVLYTGHDMGTMDSVDTFLCHWRGWVTGHPMTTLPHLSVQNWIFPSVFP